LSVVNQNWMWNFDMRHRRRQREILAGHAAMAAPLL
jgi:hypothetical protein